MSSKVASFFLTRGDKSFLQCVSRLILAKAFPPQARRKKRNKDVATPSTEQHFAVILAKSLEENLEKATNQPADVPHDALAGGGAADDAGTGRGVRVLVGAGGAKV